MYESVRVTCWNGAKVVAVLPIDVLIQIFIGDNMGNDGTERTLAEEELRETKQIAQDSNAQYEYWSSRWYRISSGAMMSMLKESTLAPISRRLRTGCWTCRMAPSDTASKNTFPMSIPMTRSAYIFVVLMINAIFRDSLKIR